MKLYTEEQVKSMLIKAKIFDGDVSENFTYILSESDILSSEKPIELPSDSEIVKDSANRANGYNVYAKEIKAPIFNEGFAEGAKWVIEQIKQQVDGK